MQVRHMPCHAPAKKTMACGKAGIPGDPVLQDAGLHLVCRAEHFDLSKARWELVCFRPHLADILLDQPHVSQLL